MPQAKLLLVDDHEVVRAGIRNALSVLPEVEIIGELGDGADLFAQLQQLQPDCLLIDVAMPDFDPLQSISQIRVLHPALKILVVSAYDDDVYVQGLLGAGVNGYHLKDQPLSDLRLAVRRVLQGEKWVTGRLVDQLVRSREAPEHELTLTPRQHEILQLLQRGLDNRNIAQALNLSVKTIENHLTRLYRQLDVGSRLEAVNYLNQHPELFPQVPRDTAFSSSPNLQPQNPQHILVVDDNPRYRQQLVRMIDNLSQAKIYEAQNTQNAVQIARQVMPALALVDVVLGDENGIACVPLLRQAAPMMRVVLFSAYPDSEFHRLGIEAGAIAFLDKKNLDLSTLSQILEDLPPRT